MLHVSLFFLYHAAEHFDTTRLMSRKLDLFVVIMRTPSHLAMVPLIEPQVPQGLLGRQPFFSILEEPRAKIPEEECVLIPNGWVESRLSFDNVVYCLCVILAFKGSDSCNQFEEGDACAPKIDLLVVSAPQEDFWSKVEGSADDGQHVSALPSLESLLADAEVDKFDFL